MKSCPKCQKGYEDETLNFCLDDGSVLTAAKLSDIPTAEYNLPLSTKVNAPGSTRKDWFDSTQRQPPRTAGSKNWIWGVGILLIFMLMCGSGIGGLALIGALSDSSDSGDSRNLVKQTDFSKWKFDNDEYITVENDGGKLKLTAKAGYYYAFFFKDFPTYNASAKVTVSNQTGKKTRFGYGLIVNSHPTRFFSKDYAFLIDSNTGEYRVVRHLDQNETEVIGWTYSNAIRMGRESNEIEVRITDLTMALYINGNSVTTVQDTTGYKEGVAGVYTSDDIPITFTDLELRK